MAGLDEFTLVLYGLAKDNGQVRADVFARKMSLLVRALRVADKYANGGKRFDLMIETLEKGSTLATIREKRSSKLRGAASSVRTLGTMISAVYEGRSVSSSPSSLLRCVDGLADGAGDNFSHGEVKYSGDNVVRLDSFFIRQASVALRQKSQELEQTEDRDFFSGVAVTSFDGVLELIDGRGSLILGKLTLSAGGLEIDCIIRQDLLSDALTKFKTRVRVAGAAIYDGTSLLPQRLNVENIEKIDMSDSLLSWKGKFRVDKNNKITAWSYDEN